jgi:putative transposase
MNDVAIGRAASPRPPQAGLSCRDDRDNGGFGETALPVRKKLPHDVPSRVESGAIFFITACVEQHGSDSLCRNDLPACLWESILHRTEMGQWWPHLVLVMPDHLHALMAFATVPGMRKTMNDWKRFTARALGIEWQRDFFDHRLRHDESFIEKAHYIRMNPVRAGLVEKPEDWPYVWSIDGALGESALPGRNGSPSRPKGIAP